MQTIGATGDGKSAVATPDGKKPKEEEECNGQHIHIHTRVRSVHSYNFIINTGGHQACTQVEVLFYLIQSISFIQLWLCHLYHHYQVPSSLRGLAVMILHGSRS